MTANKFKLSFSIILIISFYLIMFHHLTLRSNNDDLFFLHALDSKNPLDFMIDRYNGWSGRFTIEGLLSVNIRHEFLWKAIIPSAFILLACSITIISTGSLNFYYVIFVAILLLLIPSFVNEDSFYWVTGAYNYILPFSLATYSFSVFLNENRRWFNSGLSIIALLVCGFSEQSAIFLLLLCYSLLALKKVAVSWYSVIFISVLTICSALLFLAPGNHIRYAAETINWMPQFAEYSVLMKVMFGVDRVSGAISMPFNIPMLMLCASLLYLNRKRFDAGLAFWISSTLIITYIILQVFISISGNPPSSYFFNWLTPDMLYPWSAKLSSLSGTLSILYTLALAVCLMFHSCLLVSGMGRSMTTLIAIFCAFLSIVIIGFSPTVYASYFRVLYAFYILIIIATCSALSNLKA